MGLRDRLADIAAKLFAPSMDHPSRGGMTGEDSAAETDRADETDETE